jgi:RecA-family ATPase
LSTTPLRSEASLLGDPIEDWTPPKFKLERWGEITFALDEEFLIDGICPKQGVGLLYGASQAFKSFVAIHTGLWVSRAQSWAGRRTEGASVVYLAAEGSAGLRKRRQGLVMAGRAPMDGVDFALISAAPNLGTAGGDCDRLIAAIEVASISAGMIIIDTIAKVIGGADENGAGMAQFLLSAEALAQHFCCLVLAVHHTG